MSLQRGPTLIRYSVPQEVYGPPERKVAIIFDGKNVRVYLSEGHIDAEPIVVLPGDGLEITGAISEIARLVQT